MAVYTYRASDEQGEIVEGTMEARDEQGVVDRLQSLGLLPIKVEHPPAGTPHTAPVALGSSLKRIRGRDLTTFTRELATLLGAGFPLERSLDTLSSLTENPRLKEVILQILDELRGGSSFSDCLAKHPRLFSDTYVNMVRSGEAGGFLENIVDRLAGYMENAQEVREYIASAMVYPIILVTVGGAAVAILLTMVIPKFAQIFAEQGKALPVSTQVLITVSVGVRHNWWLIALVLAALVLGIRAYRRTEQGAHWYDALKIRLPLIGKFFLLAETARFSRTLGTLLANGIPLYQSLLVVRDSVGNRVFAGAVQEASEGLREGGGISGPLHDTGVFPALFVHMVSVGEETGNLEMMLFKAADTYEKQVQSTVKRLTALLEPIMILVLGAIVGFIVLSMLLAIFSMNDIPF
jgi:general secretion pathway protein F